MAARSHYNSIFADVRRKHPKASRSELSGLLRAAYAGNKRNPGGDTDRPTESNPRGGGLLMWGVLAAGAYFVMTRMKNPAVGG